MNRRFALSALAFATGIGLPRVVRAADPTALQLGTLGSDGSAEPFYGTDRNFFNDAGLDVNVLVAGNGAQIASAIAGGSLEVGYGTVITLLQAYLHGLEFRFIAPALVYTAPALTNIVMTGKSSNVKSAADLNGQTVAVNGLRDLTQYEMQAWIDQNGGDFKSVKLIEMPFSEMGAALEANRVAAAIFAEPFATAARAQARYLGNASLAVGNHYMLTGWFATTDWLAKNATVARRLQAVILQIARWANANRADTQQIILKHLKIAPQVAGTMVRSTYGDTKADAALVQPVIDLAVKYGDVQRVPASELLWQG